ncbi:3-hydroxyacyl-CoA dehydrogenase NAD-binding domain-containing protein [uncultured Arcobacter sp.]|uniref:3-hydroxyacyl-CoA dehydrogenase NAD-binding domain-containing protein n=1 Tax=uncultured Arcobacter sp. TaxID=165434 RepID=UPI0026080585|nr:3-hydroxyacyl-CoA dehydrogenase NAD-binding domain-containing protein [uncultured Arcobacter sp.]
MNNLTLNIDNSIATLTFDLKNSKANKLSFELLAELDKVLDDIKENSEIKALVIDSAKPSIFIAGADIKEIEAMSTQEEIYEQISKGDDILNKLEKLTIPTIAYIHGACMGGGLELALCCNYRIATTNEKTKLAFPEVKLGFFPGLGGTQRAPKLVGLMTALEMILTGKNYDAKKALKIGLVNEIFDNGQKEFKLKEFITKVLENKIQNKKLSFVNNLMQKFSLTRAYVYKKSLETIEKKVNKDFKAPYTALDVIKKTFNEPFEKGIEIEAKAFSNLAASKESKYMIKLFFMFEKLNKNFDKTQVPITNVAVLGNGVMGKGIIWLFSKFLNEVRIKIRKIEQAHDIINSVAKLYDSSIKRRSMSQNQVDFKLNKISYTDEFNGLSQTQLAIEAIIEDEDAKKEAFEELEAVMDKDSIIATNTSSISIEKLGSELKNKKNFLGIHFFNPVNIMPLVEVIPSSHTSKKTINRVIELLTSCGKTPIIVGDCAGFIVNRILLPYINEAAFILEEGSDIKTIDKLLKEFGMPMGPFTLADTVGIDIGFKVATILNESYGSRMAVAPILTKVYNDLKLLGKKDKKGFYLHNTKDLDINTEVSKLLSSNRKTFTDKEIIERCMFIMINEASRCLEEGIVNDPQIIDFAMITGTGFPPYKGGICAYANDMGISYVVDELKKYEKSYGERFKPSLLLEKLNKENKDFKTGEELWKL